MTVGNKSLVLVQIASASAFHPRAEESQLVVLEEVIADDTIARCQTDVPAGTGCGACGTDLAGCRVHRGSVSNRHSKCLVKDFALGSLHQQVLTCHWPGLQLPRDGAGSVPGWPASQHERRSSDKEAVRGSLSTFCSLRSALHTAHCTLHTAHRWLRTVPALVTFCTAPCTVFTLSTLPAVHSIHTTCCSLYPHYLLFTLSTLPAVHSIHTTCCSLYPHYLLFTLSHYLLAWVTHQPGESCRGAKRRLGAVCAWIQVRRSR